MAAVNTPHAHHPVALHGPSALHPHAPAVLVDIEADDFVAALSDAIERTAWPRFGWPAALPIARLADQGAPRALFQPIHRRFNLLLFDTHCEVFGTPRPDPKKIESSGFVVRRWAGPDNADAQMLADPRNWQAWQAWQGTTGWRALPSADAFDADPDPARRPAPRTGNPDVDARLAALRTVHPAETVNPLHALMPDLCNRARRSLLYGVVPTSEALRTPRGAAVDYSAARAPSPARDSFVAHLSPYLSRASIRSLPGARTRFDASWLNGSERQRRRDARAVRRLHPPAGLRVRSEWPRPRAATAAARRNRRRPQRNRLWTTGTRHRRCGRLPGRLRAGGDRCQRHAGRHPRRLRPGAGRLAGPLRRGRADGTRGPRGRSAHA
jgi:hypothetical protein